MNLQDFIPFLKRTFAHGVHPPEHKAYTAGLPITRLPFPPKVILPLAQHFGKPSRPIVRPGQEVVRGEPIAEADGFMSVPMHASVTGVVESIERMPSARGPKVESIIIRTYDAVGQRTMYGMERNIDRLSREELIEAVQECGMVGLGGAGFPTHVKLSVPKGFEIETLMVNGCECEPYLTTDHRLMLEDAKNLLAGIRIAMRATGAKNAVIGVEDNKMDAVKHLRATIGSATDIRVGVVKTKYPQGSEKLLIKSLLDKEVPSGGYPYEVGVVVQNVATLAGLGRLMPKRQGIIERVVTITGPGVRKPGNYLVPLGTTLRHILTQVGFSGDAGHLILGGPMMGTTVASLDVPVTKAVSGVLVMSDESVTHDADRIYPCIRCGKCLEACPVHLNPSQLGKLAAKRQYEAMAEAFHLGDCFECGCCSYVCPSNIPLTQYFRIAKAAYRDRVS